LGDRQTKQLDTQCNPDHPIGGLFAGTDARVFDTWRLGVLTGYSRSSSNVDDRHSSGRSDN
jgi:outer membrane autotransporter protein